MGRESYFRKNNFFVFLKGSTGEEEEETIEDAKIPQKVKAQEINTKLNLFKNIQAKN